MLAVLLFAQMVADVPLLAALTFILIFQWFGNAWCSCAPTCTRY
ncbi:hypothetical protein [Nonomuraea turcica]|nr:hypothetical protein [Nonomuraea sp. G32]MDP4511875.1 hypothetical protein [Nonomuraea sp. G32]